MSLLYSGFLLNHLQSYFLQILLENGILTAGLKQLGGPYIQGKCHKSKVEHDKIRKNKYQVLI